MAAPLPACFSAAGKSTAELMTMGRKDVKETDAALMRSEKIVNDTMAIGIQTAETLQGQTRQLEKVLQGAIKGQGWGDRRAGAGNGRGGWGSGGARKRGSIAWDRERETPGQLADHATQERVLMLVHMQAVQNGKGCCWEA